MAHLNDLNIGQRTNWELTYFLKPQIFLRNKNESHHRKPHWLGISPGGWPLGLRGSCLMRAVLPLHLAGPACPEAAGPAAWGSFKLCLLSLLGTHLYSFALYACCQSAPAVGSCSFLPDFLPEMPLKNKYAFGQSGSRGRSAGSSPRRAGKGFDLCARSTPLMCP